MNKKLLISLAIVSGILLLSNISYANSYEELKTALETYLQDPSLDFLGREYDKILFQHINNARTLDGELLAKINFMFDDLLTMPQQLKCMKKIILQKPNAIAYGSLAWISGLKSVLGASEFSKMAFKIGKSLFK